MLLPHSISGKLEWVGSARVFVAQTTHSPMSSPVAMPMMVEVPKSPVTAKTPKSAAARFRGRGPEEFRSPEVHLPDRSVFRIVDETGDPPRQSFRRSRASGR